MPQSFTLLSPSFRFAILASAIGFMLIEYLLARLAAKEREEAQGASSEPSHDLAESVASFGVAIGQGLIRALEALVVSIPFAFCYEHRLFDFDQKSPLALAALFILSEFFYYWHHRAAHRIRWIWATHSVHHSATRLNLTAAIRLGWTGSISGNFLFFLPLVVIGFHPVSVLGMLAINLLYQFFIHTELVRDLGPLEWVLNTPAHHRVHHASNESCLDRNYGGILIVFDRLFGTFAQAPSGEKLRYGLVGGTRMLNPFRIAFREWGAMLADAWAAPGLRAKMLTLFGPPGASHREASPLRQEAPSRHQS